MLDPELDAALNVTVFDPSCAAVKVSCPVDLDDTAGPCVTKAFTPFVTTVASEIDAADSPELFATMT